MKISQLCGCFTQDRILDNIGNCSIHGKTFMFICLNKEQQCIKNPLMCNQCLQAHKGHTFESIDKYFTPEFKNILSTGTSLNGHAVHRLTQHLLSDLIKMRAKLNNQLDKLQATIKQQLQKLIPKYPLEDKFGIPGRQINNQNIRIILDIFQRQKNHIWVPSTQKYIRTIVGQATTMLGNMLKDLENHIVSKNYQKFDEEEGQKRTAQFITKYQSKFNPQKNYFVWSQYDKHQNIKIHDYGLIAKYVSNSPAKPAALATNPFTSSICKIYIKITKLIKTAIIFDATLVALGVCLPQVAKIFGYKQLTQPAHGAFMIGSNGKCYHSNLQKYNKKQSQFSFGQGDVIAISIDFVDKLVYFSKWGFFQRHFKMELNIKNQDIQKLRPCVMFYGQVGAIVHIVNQNVYKQRQEEQPYDL